MSARLDVDVIILDLFGVVIAFDNDIVYRRLARHCTDPEDAVKRLDGLMAGRDVITGMLNLRQVHERLARTFGLRLSYPEFEGAWLAPYSEPMPGMDEIIGTLARSYCLILLSNIDRYYFQVVRSTHPELDHFDKLLLSCDLGIAKPDPEIFRAASRLAGVDAGRCLFVDDTAAHVAVAAELGFATHQFRSTAGFAAALREAGVTGL
jgi:HAD superfamily hydrolase (TIGR01509 family)